MKTGLFTVTSRGRTLTVRAPRPAAAWWPDISAHLPGVPPDGIRPAPPDTPPDLTLPPGTGPGDARRILNAHLHLLHLTHDTLCAHACAAYHPELGAAVMLLGGHGAGKTLTALTLAHHGWRIAAADITLLAAPPGAAPTVTGGTRALIARRTPTRRWLPHLNLPATGPERADLTGPYTPTPAAPLAAALTVTTDTQPDVAALNPHTAATTWYRATSHLLDRLLDHANTPLRHLEDPAAAHHRLTRIRALTARLPLYAARGTPQQMATTAHHLATEQAQGQRCA